MLVGLRDLITPDEGLRYSLFPYRKDGFLSIYKKYRKIAVNIGNEAIKIPV